MQFDREDNTDAEHDEIVKEDSDNAGDDNNEVDWYNLVDADVSDSNKMVPVENRSDKVPTPGVSSNDHNT